MVKTVWFIKYLVWLGGYVDLSIVRPSITLNFLFLLLIFGLNVLSFSHFAFVPLLVWTLYSVSFNCFPRHLIEHTCYDLKVYPKVPCGGNLVPRVTVLATGPSKRGLRRECPASEDRSMLPWVCVRFLWAELLLACSLFLPCLPSEGDTSRRPLPDVSPLASRTVKTKPLCSLKKNSSQHCSCSLIAEKRLTNF